MASHALTDLTTTNDRAAKEASVAMAGIRSALKKAKAGKPQKISIQADSEKIVVPREAFDFGYQCATLWIDALDHRGA